MADETLNTFDDSMTGEIVRTVDWVKRHRNEARNRRRRAPLPAKEYLGNDAGTGGGTGGGGCCCNEMDCLEIDGYSGVITPAWYEFHAPSFRCHCDPASDAGAKVKLYPTDDEDIWESDAIYCRSGTADEECTNTATWIWTKTRPCTNVKTWTAIYPPCLGGGGATYESVSDGMGGWEWALLFEDCSGSGCIDTGPLPPDPPTGAGQSASGQCTPIPAALEWSALSGDGTDPTCCTAPTPSLTPTSFGETTTTECTVGTVETWEWVLDSETNPGCCQPLPPDFDGTEEDQEAETSCTVEAGDDVYAESIWRLTIGAVGYYGCDDSILEFIIDEEVIFTYGLTCPNGPWNSRAFCPQCVNSFHIKVCGPTQCDVEPPTVICLKPKLPGGLIDGGDCGQFPDCGTTMPAAWLAVLEWGAIGGMTPGTAGSMSVVLETLVAVGDTLPVICGISTCGGYAFFTSSLYPTFDDTPTRTDNFTLCVQINSGGVIAFVRWAGVAYNHQFQCDEDWFEEVDPEDEFGELCTRYNRIAVCPMIAGTDPGATGPLDITLTLYPLTTPS